MRSYLTFTIGFIVGVCFTLILAFYASRDHRE